MMSSFGRSALKAIVVPALSVSVGYCVLLQSHDPHVAFGVGGVFCSQIFKPMSLIKRMTCLVVFLSILMVFVLARQLDTFSQFATYTPRELAVSLALVIFYAVLPFYDQA